MLSADTPLITVVVTFYNQAGYVSRAIQSVLSQTYKHIELIVIDDGSSDATEQEVLRFPASCMRFIPKKNGGVASARNLGINNASGEYIAFLDGDDVFLPNKIEVLVTKLKAANFPICVMVSSCYEVSKAGRLVSKYIQRQRTSTPKSDPISTFSKMIPSIAIYHRTIFEDLGGFPEALRINEDGAFNLRVFRRYPIIFIPDILVILQSDDSGKSRNVLQTYDGAYEAMEKKVNYLKQWLGQGDAAEYRNIHIRNVFCGFLSVGRIEIASEWLKLIDRHHVKMDTREARIAILSVKCGVNIYGRLRNLKRAVSMRRLKREAALIQEQLSHW